MVTHSDKPQHSKLKTFFLEARSSGLLSIVNITSVVYIIVLGLTFKDYYHVMADWIVISQSIGVAIIIANMFLLHRTKNVPLSASVMLFIILAIHMINITFAGGIDTVHFAWIFIIPILAGGTMGWRGQVFFWFLCVLGTIYYAIFPENMDVLPYEDSMGYTLMTRLMCITIFSLIMLIYYFVLNERMEELKHALGLASFESNLFLGVFNSNAQGVILVDNKGNIERANPQAHTMFGYPDKGLIGMPISKIGIPEKPLSSSESEDISNQSQQIHTQNNETLWIEYSTLKITGKIGTTNTLFTIEDITTRKNYESELSHLANYDYLTQLPNRLYAQKRLTQWVKSGERNNRKFSVLFIDLDKFKNVNDIKGHEAGDAVLVEVASRLSSVVGDTDLVARFGGDEFVLVIDELPNQDQLIQLINQIQTQICLPIAYGNNEYLIGCSIGISQFPADGNEVNDLLRKADTAMYKAKSNGRGSYQFYNAEHDKSIKRKVKISRELNYAIEREELFLVYQPIYDSEEKVCGAEALIRWNNQSMGMIGPDEFIPISEENGLIVPIGLWVIDRACKELKRWHTLGHKHLTMSVNVSYKQFSQHNLAQELSLALDKYQLAGEAITLELTERIFAEDLDLVQDTISHFSTMGVNTAIDDFGVGYSSLSYLAKTDFHGIKIDRSFVKDIEINPSTLNLCTAIMSMAKSLDLSVTAEGVEKAEHLRILIQLKVNKFQGYYLSKPMKSEEIDLLLKGL